MTRLRASLVPILVLVAALVLGACGDSESDAAATVNGVTIDDAEFRDELDILRDHPEFALNALSAQATSSSPSVIDQGFAASVLRTRIFASLVDQEFQRRNLTITDQARAELEETAGEQFLALLDELPQDYADGFRTWNAQLVVLRDHLEAEALARPDRVSDDEVRQFYDDYQALFTQEEVCARHILLETEAEADEVIAELDAGADFGELAQERSTDPSAQTNAGDLGCTGPGLYVPEFEAAVWEGPVGEVQGPVQTDFGFHVIVVDSRGVPGFESIEPAIRSFLESEASRQGQPMLELLIQQMMLTADISVNRKYGVWDAETLSIVPASSTTADGTGS